MVVFEISLQDLIGNNARSDFFIQGKVKSQDSVIAEMIYCFDKPKDMNIQSPRLESSVNLDDNSVTISTDVFAKGVYLQFEGVDATFSDNYFDMVPGETKVVQFSDVSTATNTLNLKVRSYYLK